MKTLILIRHAKSSWKHDVTDTDRPLKNRGFTDAHLVSMSLKSRNLEIDALFSSPAKRAFSTCEIFTNNLDIDINNVLISDNLYDFGGFKVVDFIKNLKQNLQTVMIFGHNHALTTICNIFGHICIENLPTSGVVVIDFEIDSWSAVKNGKTRFTLFPRDLK